MGEYHHVPDELRPLVDAGFEIFPLAPGRKKPRDVGWQRIDYGEFDFERWDGGIGIRFSENQVVVDGDPRNYAEGDDPIKRLSQDIGFDLTTALTVSTGGGGWHYYLRLPDGVTVKNGSLGPSGPSSEHELNCPGRAGRCSALTGTLSTAAALYQVMPSWGWGMVIS